MPGGQALGDWLSFRNGAAGDYAHTAPHPVFGANGMYNHSTRANVYEPSVIIGRVGSYCGSVHYAPNAAWVTENALIATPKAGSPARFWAYALTHLDLNSWRSGSGQPLLNQSILRNIPFTPPSTPEQQAIAEVLGALDDKIAANTRLAATADEYARTRFAQLARAARRGEPTYDDVAVISGGGTPSTKTPDFWDGTINWATPTDVTGLAAPFLWSTERKITDTGLASCASSLYPTGTILMTSRATIGAFALAQEPTAVNQGFITVQTRGSIPQMWLFHEMRYRVSEYLSWANGATFLELSRGSFKKLPVMLADNSIMHEFADEATTLHTVAANLTQENRTLAATRDALLPKLMSGALRVRDAERIVATSV